MTPETRKIKVSLLLFLLIILSGTASAQKMMRGIVVDSISLSNLSGVHVKVKNSDLTAVSDMNGIFMIMVNKSDTLIFSYVGYSKSKLPVAFDDEIMFVRMHDESIMLKEVVIRDRAYHLNRKYVPSRTLSETKPLKAASNSINFAYFTKEEREKRKLVAVIQEMKKVEVYVDVVNSPSFREEVMERNSITEERFYELLASFNQANNDLMHSGNEELIVSTLLFYFEHASARK
ncbi:MAG: hypothetical protein HOP08_06410 [Cyclobacteriaceae bacterium]|nr:hypothetical protein [Cyclobacteriaceae bacterium]